MVALPAVDEDQTVPVSSAFNTTKKKKTSAMTALLHKMAIKASYSKQDTHPHYSSRPALHSLQFSAEEEDEDEIDEEDDEEFREVSENPPSHLYSPARTVTTSTYSLTSGPLITSRGRSSQPSIASSSYSSSERSTNCPRLLASAPSSSAAPSPSISSSPSPSLCEDQQQHINNPLSSQKTLLSQLASSISASKTTFALLKASSSACASLDYVHSQAEKAMAEELQTLSDLHIRLDYSLCQQLDFGMKQDSLYHETSGDHDQSMGLDARNAERQEAMLKSYEGIISRFHGEIRKKNMTMETLKETLAKSMLRGEKLERRIKALEAKLSPGQPN